MGTTTFGIFDHIEAIPGTDTARVLRDRLDLVRMADEAGFTGFHLAEHHGPPHRHRLQRRQRHAAEAADEAPDRVRAVVIRQLSPAEQVRTHGTPEPIRESSARPRHRPHLEVRAPDGFRLLSTLRDRGVLGGP